MTQRDHDITARLDRLERENRRLKRFGGGLLVALGAVGLMSASATFCKTVWAERLVLRDSSGQDRLTMDAYTSQTPTVTMRDKAGKSVARLSWKDGVSIEMLDKKGEACSTTHIDREGRVTTSGGEEADIISMAR